jgi:hypothetical protein
MNQINPLTKLTNHELELRLKELASKERKLLHVILEHIKEFESRKLHLARAYSSVFEYLVKELGYSNSAAMRRLEAARLLRDVPVVAQKIQEGSVNLSQIGELSRALKEKEKISGDKVSSAIKADLVFAICGKTTKETQKELAVALDIPVQEYEREKVQQDQSCRIEITLSKDQLEKFGQCRDLAAHLLMQNFGNDTSWASLFEVLADQYLAKKKPLTVPIAASAMDGRIYKRATPVLKRAILNRDGCCQYRDPISGKQCQSKFGLEVDHKTSQWAGGLHSVENLRVLCRTHNVFKYQLESGIRTLG